MKEPIALIRADTGEALFWCCAVCGTFCGDREDFARYHCGGRPCEDCGEACKAHYTKCEACINKADAEKDAKRKAEAERICAEDYGDPVYWDEQDNYYPDVGEAWEAIQDEFIADIEGARAQTLWACDKSHLVLCADDIIENALESQEHYEEAYDAISGKALTELRTFCEAWNNAHGSQVESWFPNGKLVYIPETWWAEYKKEVEEQECGS